VPLYIVSANIFKVPVYYAILHDICCAGSYLFFLKDTVQCWLRWDCPRWFLFVLQRRNDEMFHHQRKWNRSLARSSL